MFDAEAEGGGGRRALLRPGDDVGVGALLGSGGRIVGDLVGGSKALRAMSLARSPMAWKPSWKPAAGAFGGHLVERALIVAGEAGVAGIVGVGLVHGGGAGAERAVHEALELGEMQEGIVGGMAGATLLEGLRRGG